MKIKNTNINITKTKNIFRELQAEVLVPRQKELQVCNLKQITSPKVSGKAG